MAETGKTAASSDAAPRGGQADAGPAPAQRRSPLPPIPVPSGVRLPAPGQLLWLGGLGALAALEVIEWPVALVVAAGTYVAEQRAKRAAEQQRLLSRRE
jgi:hypothetical protein